MRNDLFISGSNNPMTPRAGGLITSCSRVPVGATGAKVVQACSVNGPNRDATVELLTGWYSVTSMLPWSRELAGFLWPR